MIPKVIHYCWFGKNPLPDSAKKCIDSWRKFLPNYEIKEWNEENYDVNKIPYIKEAYKSKKYAFVSDYARFDILYHYGGVYFDTDVELIKPVDDIIKKSFMGQELNSNFDKVRNMSEKEISVADIMVVNPGLGIAAPPKFPLYKEILDFYGSKHFILENGNIDTTTICKYTTDILKKYGYNEYLKKIQEVAGVMIYPPEYFCPMNYITEELILTANTRSIHWYGASWKSDYDTLFADKRMHFIDKYGEKKGYIYYKIYTIPYRIKRAVVERGIIGTVKFAFEKTYIFFEKEV